MRSSKLVTKTLKLSSLSQSDVKTMFHLMCEYYEDVTWKEYRRDLYKKDAVILLRDRNTQEIKGFSTLLNIRMIINGKKVFGVFSGDTVIDKKYWGQRVLGKAFLKYLVIEKLKRVFRSYWWFLMSKGYKTYLLMANNFGEYYPHFQKPTPLATKQIMNAFYGSAYAEKYDEKTGLIQFSGPSCRLKRNVANVNRELKQSDPKVDFFVKKNPEWYQGTELACIAKMSLWMPLCYQIKSAFKLSVFSKLWKSERPERGTRVLPQKGDI